MHLKKLQTELKKLWESDRRRQDEVWDTGIFGKTNEGRGTK